MAYSKHKTKEVPMAVTIGKAELKSVPAKTESGEPIKTADGKQVYKYLMCVTLMNDSDEDVTGTVELGVIWQTPPAQPNRYDQICKRTVTVPKRKVIRRHRAEGKSPGTLEVCCAVSTRMAGDIMNFGGKPSAYFSE